MKKNKNTKTRRVYYKIKYFINGSIAKRKLRSAKRKGVLPKDSLKLYRALAKAHMDI